MDCDKAVVRMHHYLDGELTVWRRWTITRHLNRCPPCAEGYVYEVEFRQIVASRCRDQMPPEVRQRIVEALGCGFDGMSTANEGPSSATTPPYDEH